MVCRTIKPTQKAQPTIRQINVTNLTPSQQKELFIDNLNQAGFISFSKKKKGKQTLYTFTYR